MRSNSLIREAKFVLGLVIACIVATWFLGASVSRSGELETALILYAWTSAVLLLLTWRVTISYAPIAFRLPAFWLTTLLMAMAAVLTEDHQVMDEGANVLAWGLWGLLAAWLLIGASHAIDLLVNAKADLARAFAALAATSLAATFLLAGATHALAPSLALSPAGQLLVTVGNRWLAFASVRLTLLGIYILAQLVLAAQLMADDPFVAPDPSALFTLPTLPVLAALLQVLRWPVWMLYVVLGFTLKFAKHLGRAMRHFIEYWVTQVLYSSVSLVVGPAIILVGNRLIAGVSARIVQRLATASQGSLWHQGAAFLAVHLEMILALSLLAIAPAAIGFRASADEVPAGWRNRLWFPAAHYWESAGMESALSVGRAYSLAGIILVAVPVAMLIPGGTGFGFFSAVYSLIVGGAAVGYWAIDRRRKP